MISFEKNINKETFEIHLDTEGIDKLIDILVKLKTAENSDHIHLQTKSYGGSELSEETQGIDNEVLNQLDLFYWK